MGPQIQDVQQSGTSEIVGQVHTAYCRVRCGSVGHIYCWSGSRSLGCGTVGHTV